MRQEDNHPERLCAWGQNSERGECLKAKYNEIYV